MKEARVVIWEREGGEAFQSFCIPRGVVLCQHFGTQLQSYFCASEFYRVGLRYGVLNNLDPKEYDKVSAVSVLLLPKRGHDKCICFGIMIM